MCGPNADRAWNADRTGKTCAYVSVDATGILMQGPDGAQADGRMGYVGMVYNPHPRRPDDEALARPCDGAGYLAGLYTLAERGARMGRPAAQVGMGRAEQWIALSDGGSGLEEFFDVHFPGAVKINDFRHATGDRAALARPLRPGAAGEDLLSDWGHRLKHEGGASLVATLGGLDRRGMSNDAKAAHDRGLTDFRNQARRMDYPAYLRRGWEIGSGPVESACKTVLNQRLGRGGMRWGEAGGDAVAHLRALYRSDPD